MNELAALPYSGFTRVPAQAKITKLLIYETGQYHQQYRRVFDTNPDGYVVARFKEQLGQDRHYSPMSFTGIGQDFLKPVAGVNPQTDGIEINEGWNARRTRFMMEVEIDSAIGTKNRMIATGWTTHVGATPMGIALGAAQRLAVDHQMQFFISTIIPIQTQTEYGPMGQVVRHNVVAPSHVLADSNYTNIYNQNFLERMRPQDLFTQMSRTHIHGLRDNKGDIPGVGKVLFDGRTAATNQASMSLRANVIPSTYLARVAENYSNAQTTTNDPRTAGRDLYTQARFFARETMVTDNELLKLLYEVRGEPSGNMFQFKDLLRLDPTVDQRVVGVVSGPTTRLTGLHEQGQSMEWYGRDNMTLAATIISQCVPGLMSELAITTIGFKMTNQMAATGMYSAVDASTHLGRMGYSPPMMHYNAQGFSGQDMTQDLKAFELRFWGEVMRDLSIDNQLPFELQVDCSLMGETVVTLSLDGKPRISYVTPSFCDALLTPLLTPNKDHVVKVAEDFSLMLSAVIPSDHLETNSAPLFGGRL